MQVWVVANLLHLDKLPPNPPLHRRTDQIHSYRIEVRVVVDFLQQQAKDAEVVRMQELVRLQSQTITDFKKQETSHQDSAVTQTNKSRTASAWWQLLEGKGLWTCFRKAPPTTCCWVCLAELPTRRFPRACCHHHGQERPFFFRRETGEIWVPLMAGLLHLFQQSLGLGTLVELLTHVRSNSFYPVMEVVIPSYLLHCLISSIILCFMLQGSRLHQLLQGPLVLEVQYRRSSTGGVFMNSCGGYPRVIATSQNSRHP